MRALTISSRPEQQVHGPIRICVTCRKPRPQADLIRLSIDKGTGQVAVTSWPWGANNLSRGRSAYICPDPSCVEQALKTTRLKHALEGRRRKGQPNRRNVEWPLEAQLIQLIRSICTDAGKTCQNTVRKEGSE